MTGVGIPKAPGVAGTPLLFDVGNGYTGVHLIMVIKLYVCFCVVSCYFTIKRLKKRAEYAVLWYYSSRASVLAALGCSEWVTGTGHLPFLLAPDPLL